MFGSIIPDEGNSKEENRNGKELYSLIWSHNHDKYQMI
jgi:hypothetical protein